MPRIPVRPDLDQLRRQAKDLLRAIRRGEAPAVADLRKYHRKPVDPASAKLSDAQHVLARTYEAPSWPRRAGAGKQSGTNRRDDVEEVRALVAKHPRLLHEHATIRDSNWGPPMAYAANLGRDRIIRMLHDLGAKDLVWALGRATLQGKIETARMLHGMMGAPLPPAGALGGPAYTLSDSGTALLFELGAKIRDESGKSLAPVDVVLCTDSRKPEAKHRILGMYVEHGLVLPDTPMMAFHRGRIDLLEEHLRRDPGLLRRTFDRGEIFPPEIGCLPEWPVHGTPLEGATLLHLCVDYAEMEIAQWLLQRGMEVDARAAVDADGFGGHTALFGTVVSAPNFWMNYGRRPEEAPFTRLLLDRGADPNARASLRKQMEPGGEVFAFRDVTPLGWGERFPDKLLVGALAMRLIAEKGGRP